MPGIHGLQYDNLKTTLIKQRGFLFIHFLSFKAIFYKEKYTQFRGEKMKITSIIPLNKASPENFYKVKSIRLKNSDKKRISDLGLIPKTIIKVLNKSPLGDPTAYLIRGSVIALRSEYTEKIIVEKI